MPEVCIASGRVVRGAYIARMPPLSRAARAFAAGTLALSCAAPPPTPSTVIAAADQRSGTTALLIAVSAVDDHVAWASGQDATWLRTRDGGEHWEVGRVPGADSLQFRDVEAFDANEAFLLSIGNGPQSRIYHTADGGAHWTLQFTNADPKGFYDCLGFWDRARGIAIGDAVNDAISLLRTNDGGAHWERVPPDSLPRALPGEGSFAASGTCLATRPGGRAWIVMNNAAHARVMSTRDYGAHWRIDTLPLTTRDGVGAQSVSFRDDLHGIVLGGGYAAKPGDVEVALTRDGGVTWSNGGSPPLATGVWGGVYVPHARDALVVAVGPSGAAYSNDDGATWARIDSLVYWSVGFASPNAGWAGGKGGRITRLTTAR